jgi:hypothetical protein
MRSQRVPAIFGNSKAALHRPILLGDNWLAAHPRATRIRKSVEEIAASGLTLPKLTVAANLLGDLVKG